MFSHSQPPQVRPATPWVMAQTWHDLLFAHWPIARARMEQLLPAGLHLDTYSGDAWVGVVPFRMSGVRARWLPPIYGFAAFPELNVRTYVTDGEKPGVYFFSLDAGNPVAVAVARRWFHLPYFNALMQQRNEAYVSIRTHRNAPAALFSARYWPTGEPFTAAPGSLEHWLTERYCLYTSDRHGHIYRGDIHHPPWPLQPAAADIRHNTMTQPHGIYLPDIPPLLHFARRLHVHIWPLKRLRRPPSEP